PLNALLTLSSPVSVLLGPAHHRGAKTQREITTEAPRHGGTRIIFSVPLCLRGFHFLDSPCSRVFVAAPSVDCEVPLATEAPRHREKLPQRHRDTEERESSSPCLCASVVPTS